MRRACSRHQKAASRIEVCSRKSRTHLCIVSVLGGFMEGLGGLRMGISGGGGAVGVRGCGGVAKVLMGFCEGRALHGVVQRGLERGGVVYQRLGRELGGWR